jgi:uncharacterized protein (TIGR00661 family)
LRRDLQEEQVEGKLRFRPFSEDRFIDDLASCRAVVAGGGFTLMGEAVYLRKPMLSIPLGRQFEQVLNGRYLAHYGYGMTAPSLDDPALLSQFLGELPRFEESLADYQQDGNEAMFAELLGLLDRAEAGVL